MSKGLLDMLLFVSLVTLVVVLEQVLIVSSLGCDYSSSIKSHQNKMTVV
jgi:hypothetical protein